MGPTLTIASEKDGHTLTDRATYLAFRTRTKLPILLEGDAPLLNALGAGVVPAVAYLGSAALA